ncbi:tubulin epsilon and delta complex protein 1 isoform X3 [Amblyraja radiata]|uniref:tubulin epsilon and delta complex protein 1 isoform X3 n=1 Tax=Amblyraja radiata TaxID=386614 RepID=UPI0014020C62|nr:tubulin epsilon and delta complex protein 1 isoform X3 [Amblyraja radiata]
MTVKAAIAAVCRVLAGAGAGVGALSPEAFRQAKFDRDEVTADFWKLLYCLLKLVSENKNCAVTDLGHQIEYVKAAVCYYGYGFLDFYQLPADGSRGSRDLLLVFSWLLQKIHLFEKLLERQRLRVEDQVSLCMIHLYTRGCRSGQSYSHLFATETRLIRDPERCSEFVQLLERENMWLEAYLEWRQLEPLFWQWMESVLAAKLQDTQNPRDENSIAATAHSPALSGDHVDRVTFKEMDHLSSEILKLQMKLQDGQKTKIKTTEDKEREVRSHTGWDEFVCPTQCDVEKKLGVLHARISHRWRQHGHARLALRDNSSAKSTKFSPAKPDIGCLTALEVTTQLRTEEAALKRELQEMQQLCKESLGEVVEKLDGVICMPPL